MDGYGLGGNGGNGPAFAFKTGLVVTQAIDGDDVKVLLQYGIVHQVAAAIPGARRSMDHEQGRQGICSCGGTTIY